MVKHREIDLAFHVRRIFAVVDMSLLFCLASFHRTLLTIVVADIAESYGVKIADLNSLSSIFLYSYGVMQPFIGLLSDIMEPAFLTGFAQILATAGSIIIGFSNSVSVGGLGRLLTGIGCAPIYVPACRTMANWFSLKWYPLLSGILLCAGAIGTLLGQGPLALLCNAIGWRNSFFIMAGVTGFLSIMTLLFIRGDPTAYGYDEVNEEMLEAEAHNGCKDLLKQLWKNLLMVIKRVDFWIMCVFSLVTNGPYYSFAGMWASPYLVDVFGMTKKKASFVLTIMSIGCIVCTLAYPAISDLLHTRKWMLLGTSVIGLGASIYGYVVNEKMSLIAIYAVFILYGFGTMPVSSVSYSLAREYYHPLIAGTAIGLLNFLAMFLSGLIQTISSELIKRKGEGEGNAYTIEGYRDGIWLLNTICLGTATLCSLILSESDFILKQKKEKEDALLISKYDNENEHISYT